MKQIEQTSAGNDPVSGVLEAELGGRTAAITGSFDPITVGHEELARRASPLFDRVYFVILANAEKRSGMFRAEDRLFFAKKVAEHLREAEGIANVDAILYNGLTSDAAHLLHAKYLIRGVRSASDFDYENNLANIMKRFDPELETIFFPASPTLACISSTHVRELVKYNFTLAGAVPDCIADDMMRIYRGYAAEWRLK